MEPTPTQLQKQIDDLKKQYENFTKSNAIPRDVQTAFQTRLQLGGLIGIAGNGTMSGGKLDVFHPSITSASIGVATINNNSFTPQGYNIAGGKNTGFYRFFEGSFSQTWNLDYIIIFKA